MQGASQHHEAIPDAGLGALYRLALSPFLFEQQVLRKMRIIKNMKLETVVEVFFSNHTGSGQLSIKGAASSLGLEGSADYQLLRFLADQPSFDSYSLRIQLRNSGFSQPPELKRPVAQDRTADRLLTTFLQPLTRALFEAGDTEPCFSTVLQRLCTGGEPTQRISQFTAGLGCDTQAIVHFLEDYADTVLSLAYYRECLEEMTPAIDDVIESVRDLRSSYQARHDKLLRSTLDMVEASTNEMIASVTGRIESFEHSTSGFWSGVTAGTFSGMPGQFRSYQGAISAIICALAVKMGRWMDQFPTPGLGNPARRIGLVMSEMRQGMEHIQGILGSAPALAIPAAS